MSDRLSSKFWLGMLTLLSISVAVMLTISTKWIRAENATKATVCQEMADEVLAGGASRFDYMATRCSADLLVQAEEA